MKTFTFRKLFFIGFSFILSVTALSGQEGEFVTVEGMEFKANGLPYYFLGTNMWYGMNLGMEGEAGDRDRLIRELDLLQSKGVNNLRVMGSSEGPDSEPLRVVPAMQIAPGEYNEAVCVGLDFLLAEMGKRGMYAVVCLNNFWSWSGGMSQYLSWASQDRIPYPPPAEGGDWGRFQQFSSQFFSNTKAQKLFKQHLKVLLNRKNSITGILYKDDPTIMAWQLGNEPRGYENIKAYRKWLHKTAKYLKRLDKNHLVSIGSEGNTANHFAGTHFKTDHKSKFIDYATMHIWVQNWSWFDPKKGEETFQDAVSKAKAYLEEHVNIANELSMPVVLEEFGISRDLADHHPEAPTQYRDEYFETIFASLFQLASEGRGIAGGNFWSWGGEGRPGIPNGMWRPGDDLIGDPPHESQGWYSVYDSDHSTMTIIEKYAKMFRKLGDKTTVGSQ